MKSNEAKKSKKVFKAELAPFYPKYFRIDEQYIIDGKIEITAKSLTGHAVCPACGKISRSYHSTYKRTIEDLPLLGKNVLIKITAYRYYCENSDCAQKVFAEELEGFAGWFRRKTERLEDLITSIALNTNCEGCARICGVMGINISGDYVINLLKERFSGQAPKCGEIIGVDDWAYKKGHTYGTIVCDGNTRKPVAVFDGRDGKNLKEWLQQNKQIKIVTRDRAGAYAKAINEALPEAIQVADRFHLFQNMMDTVKETLRARVPERVEVSGLRPKGIEEEDENAQTSSKKNNVIKIVL
jgi:transposase